MRKSVPKVNGLAQGHLAGQWRSCLLQSGIQEKGGLEVGTGVSPSPPSLWEALGVMDPLECPQPLLSDGCCDLASGLLPSTMVLCDVPPALLQACGL